MQHFDTFPLGLLPTPTLLPAEALRRLVHSGGQRPFLLDGAANADGLGRYSYAGCDPRCRFRIADIDALPLCTATQPTAGRYLLTPARADSPGASRVEAPSIPLWQRLGAVVRSWAPLVAVGLLDYELGRASERLPQQAKPHGLGTAAVDFAGYDAVYRFDALTATADLLAIDAAAAERLRRRLRQPAAADPPLRCGTLRSELSRAEYARSVGQILDRLRAGDCYQVNLCRRLRANMPRQSALAAYLRLRRLAPAPLGCYLELGPLAGSGPGPALLSNSPELLLHLDWATGIVETRPIKGTRRRGGSRVEDAALQAELCRSPKDRAEHIMIVDLLRNDLGRIAEPGSVVVSGLLRCIELPTVYHLVSTIQARPAAGIGLGELLPALFPGGSITGAPKLAAMQLIDELEPYRRGPFYGAVGWLGPTGGTLALCIRTAVATGDELVLAVGGGIVLDSTAEDEWQETEAKAAAWKRALGQRETAT